MAPKLKIKDDPKKLALLCALLNLLYEENREKYISEMFQKTFKMGKEAAGGAVKFYNMITEAQKKL